MTHNEKKSFFYPLKAQEGPNVYSIENAPLDDHGRFVLNTWGDTLFELLENAIILELDEDGSEFSQYLIDDFEDDIKSIIYDTIETEIWDICQHHYSRSY